jgi:hypothetical protein
LDCPSDAVRLDEEHSGTVDVEATPTVVGAEVPVDPVVGEDEEPVVGETETTVVVEDGPPALVVGLAECVEDPHATARVTTAPTASA